MTDWYGDLATAACTRERCDALTGARGGRRQQFTRSLRKMLKWILD